MQTRRGFLVCIPALALLGSRSGADVSAIGTTLDLTGSVQLARAGASLALHKADPLQEGDEVATAAASTAALELFTKTHINLGADSRLLIDRFLAEMGGTVTVGGAMVFDRPDDLPKIELTVQNAFAQIGVRGTRFFAGPSKGVYGIFVARGAVEVRAGGEIRRLGAGDGVDIAAPGAVPSAVAQWKEPRIKAAFESVGLTP